METGCFASNHTDAGSPTRKSILPLSDAYVPLRDRKRRRLTVDLDVCYVPAAILLSRRKLE